VAGEPVALLASRDEANAPRLLAEAPPAETGLNILWPVDQPSRLVGLPPDEPTAAEASPAPAAERVAESKAADTMPAAPVLSLAAQRAEQCLQTGNRYKAEGKAKKALLCYGEALEKDPSYVPALLSRALLRRQTRDLDNALHDYAEAIRLDAGCSQAYLGRASIYIEQGRLAEALLDCNSGLSREPGRAVYYVLRGLIYTRMGNLNRALQEADEAVALDRQLASAYVLRGNLRSKKDLSQEALEDYREAIRLRPNEFRYYHEFGLVLLRLGEHEQAAVSFAKVLEMAPRFQAARLSRAAALREGGDHAGAESEYTEYLRLCPDTAAAYYQRGLCQLAQQKYEAALADFEKTIELNPKDSAAWTAKAKALAQWETTERAKRPPSGLDTSMDPPPAAATMPVSAAATASAKGNNAKTVPSRTRPASSPRYPKPDSGFSPQWKRTARWGGIVALSALLAFGSFKLLANAMHSPYLPEEDNEVASAQLSAPELFQRFKSGAADANLSERVVEVKGSVVRSQTDREPCSISLAGSRRNEIVTCTLKPKLGYHQQMLLSRVEQMGRVTIKGLCKGKKGNTIVINEGRLVQVLKSPDTRR